MAVKTSVSTWRALTSTGYRWVPARQAGVVKPGAVVYDV
jgi:hypothetical protein